MSDYPVFTRAEVIDQDDLGLDYYMVRIRAPEVVGPSLPGQFVMLKSARQMEPLLPRPFSYARLDPAAGIFDLLYRVVGKGTALMSHWHPGEPVSVLGPLGNAWPLPPLSDGESRVALVGRGLGSAPLICLAEQLERRGHHVDVYLSSRSHRLIPGLAELKPFADRVFLACDDDPATPDLVTDHLVRELTGGGRPPVTAYVCGANRLIREVAELGERHGFSGYASLEQHMACGFGACKGCVLPLAPRQGQTGRDFVYERVCLEGPIFPVQRVAAVKGVPR